MKARKILLLFLAGLLLLSGCSSKGLPWNRKRTVKSKDEPTPEETPAPTAEVREIIVDNRFTLTYDPAETLNPIYSTVTDNVTVDDLIYECLFRVTADFSAEKILCDEITTEDGRSWQIKVRDGILMHDGQPLTAQDVAYSVNLARDSTKFVSRLGNVAEFSAMDDLTIRMVLYTADYGIASLLDVPIIRYGQAGENVPAGTGPYRYKRTVNGGKLTAWKQYRDPDYAPIDAIYLSSEEYDSDVIAFTDSEIDLLTYDPTGTNLVNVRVDTEYHYYNSPILEYVGFNVNGVITSDYRVRQALYYAVDRDTIVSTDMNGAALAAPLILSPAMAGYDHNWEPKENYSLSELSMRLAEIGFNDADSDGWLEYPLDSIMADVDLKFIVNSENDYKVAAARRIANTLNSLGIKVTLQELAWNQFEAALLEGAFDMYYGEVRLTANLNPSRLVYRYGSVNYSGGKGVSDAELFRAAMGKNAIMTAMQIEDLDVTTYTDVICDWLNTPLEARSETAKALCDYFLEDSCVVPVLYKKQAVLVHRNVAPGLTPVPGSVWGDLTNVTINVNREETKE